MQKASEQNKQQDQADGQWFRSVGLRLLTAVVGIPIVVTVLWFGGWWSFAAATFVAAWGIYELYTMMVHEGYRPLLLLSLVFSLLFLVAAMLSQTVRLPLLEIGISAVLLISFPVLFIRKKLEGAMLDWSLTLVIAVYIGWPMSLLLVLRGYQIGLSAGLWWLFTVFGCIWGCDTGAFFAGHFFGKHKLAPQISPGKTWEGVVGGLLASILAAVICTVLPLKVPWYLAIVLGLLTGAAGILGDLTESLIKRQTHVKDSGQFLPGHGGILDRIDSLLFGVLVIYIFAQLIGRLA